MGLVAHTESHTPLISTELHERAQQTVKARGTIGDAGRARRRSRHSYLFRGLLRCGVCGRVMDGSVNHGRIYYRCKASGIHGPQDLIWYVQAGADAALVGAGLVTNQSPRDAAAALVAAGAPTASSRRDARPR